MKIFHKLLLSFLVPMFLCFTAITLINQNILRNSIFEQVKTDVMRELDLQTALVEEYFSRGLGIVKWIAAQEVIKSGDIKAIMTFLASEEHRHSGVFESFYYNTVDGQVFGVHDKPFNVADRYYFPKVQRGEVVFSKALQSRATGKPIVLILVPIFHNGERVGAIGGTILITNILSVLIDMALNWDGVAILWDEDKRVISRHIHHMDSDSFFFSALENTEIKTWLDQTVFKRDITHRGINEFRAGNINYLVFHNPLPATKWNFALVYDKTRILSDLGKARDASMVIIFLGLAFSFVVILLLNRTMVVPIKELIYAQSVFADGGIPTPNVTGQAQRRDEFGDLVRSFNHMKTQLTESQNHLVEAKEKAEEASSAKSQFIATVSHELKTPLQGILGATDLMSLQDQGAEVNGYIELIRKCAGRLNDLISDLLNISRTISGKLSLEQGYFPIKNLVQEVIDVAATSPQAKGVKISLAIASDVPQFVFVDQQKIQQILANLVTNAVKFSNNGDVKICVGMKKQGNQGILRFTVTDNGIGIASEHISRIFDEFYQVDRSSSRRYGGTGLGLAICRRLIALMEGAIGVHSEPGKGSEFWFEVPAQKKMRYAAE